MFKVQYGCFNGPMDVSNQRRGINPTSQAAAVVYQYRVLQASRARAPRLFLFWGRFSISPVTFGQLTFRLKENLRPQENFKVQPSPEITRKSCYIRGKIKFFFFWGHGHQRPSWHTTAFFSEFDRLRPPKPVWHANLGKAAVHATRLGYGESNRPSGLHGPQQ